MGCFSSKAHRTHVESQPLSSAAQELASPSAEQQQVIAAAAAAAEGSNSSDELELVESEQQQLQEPVKIYIIFYSMYGHVEALARKIKAGVDSIQGAQGFLFRVAETLPPDVLEKMHAPPKDDSIPGISASQLPDADAILFGFPTRYGTMAAQMKAFFDSTGALWQGQKLAGKPAGFFVSTGTQGGGQETTAWTAITQLVHHGMLYIPVGYTFGAGMFKMDDLRGGTPYGAGTFAGDGSRCPSETELQLAEHQGMYTAGIVKRLLLKN